MVIILRFIWFFGESTVNTKKNTQDLWIDQVEKCENVSLFRVHTIKVIKNTLFLIVSTIYGRKSTIGESVYVFFLFQLTKLNEDSEDQLNSLILINWHGKRDDPLHFVVLAALFSANLSNFVIIVSSFYGPKVTKNRL